MELRGGLEFLSIERAQLKQGRFRTATDKGTVVGVMLGEEGALRPGSILFYEENRRIVLAQLKDARVLVIATLTGFLIEDALTLGHYLGQLGWNIAWRERPTHWEIFVTCETDEAEMEAMMRACPLTNIAWTFRDRAPDDPEPRD